MAFQNSKISKLLMEKAEEYLVFTNNIKDLNALLRGNAVENSELKANQFYQ